MLLDAEWLIMKKYFVILVGLLINLPLSSADIYTPVTMNLEAKELSQILNKSFQDGLIIKKELKQLPQLQGLDLYAESIEYQAEFNSQFDVKDDGSFHLSVQIKNVSFSIHHFDATYKLQQNHGSLRVNVFTKIMCDSLKLVSRNDILLEGHGVLHPNGPVVHDVDLMQMPELFIESENCDAPDNYRGKLAEIATEWLNGDEAKDQILDLVNNEVILDYWNDFKKGLEFDFLGRKIFIAYVSLDFEKHLKIKVQVRWPFSSQISLNTNFPDSRSVMSYTISDLRKVLELWMPQECFKMEYTRKEIPSANDLFESRFMQFFAWKDLMNFPKDIDFKLHIRLCVNRASINHALPNGVKLNHTSIILAQLNLINNGQELPYVVAFGQGHGHLSVLSTSQGMALQLENSKFEMNARFHSGMLNWRGAKKYSGAPSMSMIFPKVISGLESSPIHIADEFSPITRNLKFSSGEGILNFEK